jgi:hypothetical protein
MHNVALTYFRARWYAVFPTIGSLYYSILVLHLHVRYDRGEDSRTARVSTTPICTAEILPLWTNLLETLQRNI